MKILFLDHDGVMVTGNKLGSRYLKRNTFSKNNPDIHISNDLDIDLKFDDFNNKHIKLLNEIIIKTNCEIVITSDWKTNSDLKELQEFYKSQGILKIPLDVTPKVKFKNNPSLNGVLEENRSDEIIKWCQNKEIDNWLVIDDLNLSNFLSNFIKTNPFTGLTINIKNKAINILNK